MKTKPKRKRRSAQRVRQTEPLEPEDLSLLTDADWATVNAALRRASERGGSKALSRALEKLAIDDPSCFVRVLAAFNPDKVRQLLLDAMAALGLTAEDLKEIVQKQQKPTKLQ
jgi:hypothetical protein